MPVLTYIFSYVRLEKNGRLKMITSFYYIWLIMSHLYFSRNIFVDVYFDTLAANLYSLLYLYSFIHMLFSLSLFCFVFFFTFFFTVFVHWIHREEPFLAVTPHRSKYLNLIMSNIYISYFSFISSSYSLSYNLYPKHISIITEYQLAY